MRGVYGFTYSICSSLSRMCFIGYNIGVAMRFYTLADFLYVDLMILIAIEELEEEGFYDEKRRELASKEA